MKKGILVLISALMFSLVATGTAFASPVLNENEANGSPTAATIYPDSVNANLYYVTPQYLGVCKDEKGQLLFSYSEFRPSGWFKLKRGLMLATLCIKEHDVAMQAAIKGVLAKNPRAQFVGLPYTSSSLALNNEVFRSLIENSDCEHAAGVIGQEQACSIEYTPRGRKEFLSALRSGVAFVIQFNYTVDGVVRLPTGVVAKTANFGMAARISKSDFGDDLEKYIFVEKAEPVAAN